MGRWGAWLRWWQWSPDGHFPTGAALIVTRKHGDRIIGSPGKGGAGKLRGVAGRTKARWCGIGDNFGMREERPHGRGFGLGQGKTGRRYPGRFGYRVGKVFLICAESATMGDKANYVTFGWLRTRMARRRMTGRLDQDNPGYVQLEGQFRKALHPELVRGGKVLAWSLKPPGWGGWS